MSPLHAQCYPRTLYVCAYIAQSLYMDAVFTIFVSLRGQCKICFTCFGVIRHIMTSIRVAVHFCESPKNKVYLGLRLGLQCFLGFIENTVICNDVIIYVCKANPTQSKLMVYSFFHLNKVRMLASVRTPI